MSKDTVAGKVREVGGKARQAVGRATGDDEGVARGAADEIGGKIQKNFGKIKDSLK